MKIKYEGKQFSVSEARMDESGMVSAILREDGAEYAGEKLVARVVATSRHGEGQTYTVFNKASTEDVKKSVSLLITEPEYLRAEEGAGGAGGVAAPMPGKIIKTLVAPGTEVKKGTPLLIMEAMKMEHTIVAPTDGKIEDFTVAEGDFVDDGKVLVEFDGE
uniref:Lipoyl-binding domain-containing protein n=1 Tax=Palpitomonas bilix TaxID=652834 RepID=A0A7S3D236_9EUKA